jgi:hypothetical protein
MGLLTIVSALVVGLSLVPSGGTLATVSGTKKVMVLRAYFHDYANSFRYTKSQVEGFMGDLDSLWKNTSYGNIDLDYQVSDPIQLPNNRSSYVTDHSDGDLSEGAQFSDVLKDAISHAPSGLDWDGLSAVLVVMAETDTSQFHRGQGKGGCNLKKGPGSSATMTVGCAIFSENPSDSDVAVWGRWAHEIGHAFQENPKPAHPSDYNNDFDLMDANYPGQTGVFEKETGKAFTGWMPTDHYADVVPNVSGVGPSWAPAGSAVGGANIDLRAMEYDPAGEPDYQAIRAYTASQNVYYLVSVRRRVLGDDLNATFGGIPDEGVMIEKVVEGGNTNINDCPSDPTPCYRWVEVKGPGGNADQLWHGGTNDSWYFDDGVGIQIGKALDADGDHYPVAIKYDLSVQPDVAISPWRSAPSNSYESQDVWVDSPVNGYGTYRYGQWTSTYGDTVPIGNGDDPAVGQVNRIYARVRNIGTSDASNVVVHIDRTDPEGRGIAGSNGFIQIDTVTSAQFPGLATIPAGGYTDVYVDYTPAFTPTPDQIAQGRFAFHTCVRVRIDAASGETVLGNQDGFDEQENIDTFEVPADGGPAAPAYQESVTLRNDDPVNPKWFDLWYLTDVPDGWTVNFNNGESGVLLAGGEVRSIPIEVVPGPVPANTAPGTRYSVDLEADFDRELIDPNKPVGQQKHLESKALGGVTVETRVMLPSTITCKARLDPDGQVVVEGTLSLSEPTDGLNVMIEGTVDDGQSIPWRWLTGSASVVPVRADGSFEGALTKADEPQPKAVVCLFAGTSTSMPAAAGPVGF